MIDKFHYQKKYKSLMIQIRRFTAEGCRWYTKFFQLIDTGGMLNFSMKRATLFPPFVLKRAILFTLLLFNKTVIVQSCL